VPDAQLLPQKSSEKWRPGPNLVAELQRLDDLKLELSLSYRERIEADPRVQLELSRELERISVKQLFIRVLAFTSGRDEVPDVVVIQWTKEEAQRVFPRGLAHVSEIKVGDVVPAEPGGSRRVRYLCAKEGLWKWAVFERVRE
jgi:hypothetical protein